MKKIINNIILFIYFNLEAEDSNSDHYWKIYRDQFIVIGEKAKVTLLILAENNSLKIKSLLINYPNTFNQIF